LEWIGLGHCLFPFSHRRWSGEEFAAPSEGW
jgi:hypothetical protein